jgi:molybdopterin molybdotransferase
LVAPEEMPSPGQIRNSNGPLLAAAILRAGGEPVELGVARDERDDLTEKIAQGLAADMLLLSGGVSTGVLDLVPSVLNESGVEQVFHKVAIKPGKPVWFGTKVANGDAKLVFGLPGNPVSSLVTFELLVRPAITLMSGRGAKGLRVQQAVLASPFQQRGERTTFYPATLQEREGRLHATPVDWKGSADLRTLTEADGWIELLAGDRDYQAGDEVSVYWI